MQQNTQAWVVKVNDSNLLKNRLNLIHEVKQRLEEVLRKAVTDLDRQGADIVVITNDELLRINRAYESVGWYPLNNHYDHEKFIGLAVINRDGVILGTICARPLDLGKKTVGDAYEDLSYIYPSDVPTGAVDRFEGIPPHAYFIRGNVWMVGGFWVNPRAAKRQGLGGSEMLTYLTRPLYALMLGQGMDVVVFMAIDRLLSGYEEGRSIINRYGVRSIVSGPTWVNHYPGEAEPDLKLNLGWVDRATLFDIMTKTPWATECFGAEKECRLAS